MAGCRSICLLHEQVLKGDFQAVEKLLDTEDPSEKDVHGNLIDQKLLIL